MNSLMEQGEQFNPLVYVKAGLGSGSWDQVSSTATAVVELAVNLGVASITGRKGKYKLTNNALDS